MGAWALVLAIEAWATYIDGYPMMHFVTYVFTAVAI